MEILGIDTPEEFDRLIAQYRSRQETIRKEVVSICRAMEGAIGWREAWDMSVKERAAVAEILERLAKEARRSFSRFDK